MQQRSSTWGENSLHSTRDSVARAVRALWRAFALPRWPARAIESAAAPLARMAPPNCLPQLGWWMVSDCPGYALMLMCATRIGIKGTFWAQGPANRIRTRGQCAFCAYPLWWVSSTNPHCQPTTTHSMHDHEGERRLPAFILTAKFLQRVVQQRQACIRRLSEHKLTTRPDSTLGEARLEPTSSVWYRNAVLSL